MDFDYNTCAFLYYPRTYSHKRHGYYMPFESFKFELIYLKTGRYSNIFSIENWQSFPTWWNVNKLRFPTS